MKLRMLISSHGVMIRVRDIRDCVVASLRLAGGGCMDSEHVLCGDHVCSNPTIHFFFFFFPFLVFCLFCSVRGAPYWYTQHLDFRLILLQYGILGLVCGFHVIPPSIQIGKYLFQSRAIFRYPHNLGTGAIIHFGSIGHTTIVRGQFKEFGNKRTISMQ